MKWGSFIHEMKMSIVHERSRANAYSWQYFKGLGKIPKTKGQTEKVELSSLVTGSELNKGASFKTRLLTRSIWILLRKP